MPGSAPFRLKVFTPKQGKHLAFIHLYTGLHRRPCVTRITKISLIRSGLPELL
jgi:hypothetical protein